MTNPEASQPESNADGQAATHLVDKLNKASLFDLALDEGAAGPKRAYALPSREDLTPLFGDMEIQDLLGFGGMGCVYKARQTRLDRSVAVKILPKELAKDELFAERFAREARAMARLNHPNIVRVHDFGQTGEICFLIMEYMDGMNLRELLDSGRIAPEESLAIFEQVCSALEYAHREGVIHRDIKPENILFSRAGHVSLADFGLARLAMDSGCEVSLTQTRQAMGTLNYMAPEQWDNPKSVDHRADIYALGILLYELLTGRVPRGSFPPASSIAGTPASLDTVIHTALQVDPELRYATVRDMLDAITRAATSDMPMEHAGTLTRVMNFGGLLRRATPSPNSVQEVRNSLQTPVIEIDRTYTVSLLVAGFCLFMTFVPWMNIDGHARVTGYESSILVDDVEIPNWLICASTAAVSALLKWKRQVHPIRATFFSIILTGASLAHIIGLVSGECELSLGGGAPVAARMNVIPFLILAALVLQQVELVWQLIRIMGLTLMSTVGLLFTRNKDRQGKPDPANRKGKAAQAAAVASPASPALDRAEEPKKQAAAATAKEPLIQQLVRLLPAELAGNIEEESRAWVARCACGHERSIWDLGGIRYKAKGEPRRFLRCPCCQKSGWHRICRHEPQPETAAH